MKITGNTVLITGGATGIGFSLAEAFVGAGNEVLICGRRKDKIAEAVKKVPRLRARVCDVSREAECEALYRWATTEAPNLNVLVNNAGVQRTVDLTKGLDALARGEDEIDINLKAAVRLSARFIPHFLGRSEAAIVNISSGLAFVPLAFMPIYCATKAALHSFSISLRHQLRKTPIRVFEIIPPTVDTGLDRGARAARGQTDRGIPPSEVAAAALRAMETSEFEAAVGMAEGLRSGARTNFDQVFNRMNH